MCVCVCVCVCRKLSVGGKAHRLTKILFRLHYYLPHISSVGVAVLVQDIQVNWPRNYYDESIWHHLCAKCILCAVVLISSEGDHGIHC